MDFLGVRVGFKNCYGVSLYRLITFVISVWLYKSYIGSELESKVSRWTDSRPARRVRQNDATSSPNSSADTELSWSVGAECGKNPSDPY